MSDKVMQQLMLNHDVVGSTLQQRGQLRSLDGLSFDSDFKLNAACAVAINRRASSTKSFFTKASSNS